MRTVNAVFEMAFDDDGKHCSANCPAFCEGMQTCGPDRLHCFFLWNEMDGDANGKGIQKLPTRGSKCFEAVKGEGK